MLSVKMAFTLFISLNMQPRFISELILDTFSSWRTYFFLSNSHNSSFSPPGGVFSTVFLERGEGVANVCSRTEQVNHSYLCDSPLNSIHHHQLVVLSVQALTQPCSQASPAFSIKVEEQRKKGLGGSVSEIVTSPLHHHQPVVLSAQCTSSKQGGCATNAGINAVVDHKLGAKNSDFNNALTSVDAEVLINTMCPCCAYLPCPRYAPGLP